MLLTKWLLLQILFWKIHEGFVRPKDCCNLRNRLGLVVNCWVIILCTEVSCKGDQIMSAKREWFISHEWFICLQLTDKTVNYYSTIHALELIYLFIYLFTQERVKKQLYPSDSYNFPPLHWKNPAKGLTVTQASIFISHVFHVSMRKSHVTPSNIEKTRTIGRMTSQNGRN